jgi:hypothetical protein
MPGIYFVVKKTPIPPPGPVEPNFIFDPDTYIPPEGDNVDFIFND